MRTGNIQKGKFNVQEGMAFVMKDLQHLLPDGSECKARKHPWLITKVEDNYVEIVMSRTINDNKENKHKDYLYDKEEIEDIVNPCPPMDDRRERESAITKDRFKVLPKKVLFSHNIEILNGNTKERNFGTEGLKSLCMDEKTVKILRQECLKYMDNIPDELFDPFGVQKAQEMLDDFEDGYPVPEGFSKEKFRKKYGWEHIKDADPNAIYPKEEEMAWYEKKDEKLLNIVRERDDELTLTEEDLKGIPCPKSFSL